MPHYIDADFLISELKKHNGSNWHSMTWNTSMIASLLRNAQKVDAVEVVRCKDCKFWETKDCVMDWCIKMISTEENDYCSFGKRKE